METKNITHYFIHDDILIQLYHFATASVTTGSVNPAAHFYVRAIYVITNNGVLIKYKSKNITRHFIHNYKFYNYICICTHP